jgi:hypothetical protein
MAGGLPDFSNGRALDHTLGPFRDSVGRAVWVDIFLITQQFRLVRAPGDAPLSDGSHPAAGGIGRPFQSSAWERLVCIPATRALGSYVAWMPALVRSTMHVSGGVGCCLTR